MVVQWSLLIVTQWSLLVVAQRSPGEVATIWLGHSDWSWWLDGALSWWFNGVSSSWLNGVQQEARLYGWGTRLGHCSFMKSCHGGPMESPRRGAMESSKGRDYPAGALGLVMVA